MKLCPMIAALISLSFLLVAYGPAAEAPGGLYFPPPDGEWESIRPEDAGWDSAKLNAALDFAGERKSSGVVVLHRGRIMAERYWELGSPETSENRQPNRYSSMRHGADAEGRAIEDVASVQKSVISVLVGIARHRGLVQLGDPVDKYLGEGWSKAPREAEARITLRHLISMSTGLTGKLEYNAPAGTKWQYNTAAYALTRDALAAAAGKDPNALTSEWLTGRIGMADSSWVPRPGIIQRMAANTHGFATTARDLARFGLLVLADGVWEETVIIEDREYLRESLLPSQEMNPSYGYLWWLNGQSHAMRGAGQTRTPGWLIPSAPKDLVAGLGALGRKLYVVPSLGIVITRLGDAAEIAGEERFNRGFWARMMAAAPGS